MLSIEHKSTSQVLLQAADRNKESVLSLSPQGTAYQGVESESWKLSL
jgi:hypothetical protein